MSILSLNTADIFNAIGGGSPLSIINSVTHPAYNIRTHGIGSTALEYSGMMSLSNNGRATITTAPVEGGKYQSINKVREPNRVQCAIVISGLTGFSGNIPNIFGLTMTSRSVTLARIKEMLETAQMYDIESPDGVLEGYDLVDHSHKVTAQSGVTLLTVYLEFQEVIDQMEVQLSGGQSDSKPTTNETAGGVTGMSSVPKQANAQSSALDDLSKSWNNLKKATGELTDQVTGSVTDSFQSAAQTVGKTASEVAKSATDKATGIVKSISGAIS